MIPIAHSGHWLVNVLYLLPLVIALGVLGWQKFRGNADDPGRAAPDKSARRPTARHELSRSSRLLHITHVIGR